MNYLLVFIMIAATISGCQNRIQPSREINYFDLAASRELVDQGVKYLRLGQLDSAEASFYLAEQLTGLAAAIDGRGCVAFLRRDLDEAEKQFKRALLKDPSYLIPLSNLALVYEVNGDRELAQRLYERFLREQPTNFRVRNNYAGLLFDEAQPLALAHARDELRQASVLARSSVVEQNLLRTLGH